MGRDGRAEAGRSQTNTILGGRSRAPCTLPRAPMPVTEGAGILRHTGLPDEGTAGNIPAATAQWSVHPASSGGCGHSSP